MSNTIQSNPIHSLTNPFSRSSWRPAILRSTLVVALASPAFSPGARAVCQQGCDAGNENAFLGEDALLSNTTGIFNTAAGHFALRNTTSGFSNTAVGASTLTLNTVGEVNTASGAGTLFFNTSGSHNTASGGSALFNNTVGNDTRRVEAPRFLTTKMGVRMSPSVKMRS